MLPDVTQPGSLMLAPVSLRSVAEALVTVTIALTAKESIAAEMIGMLRLRSGRQPRDAAARRLVAELSAESEFFRTIWSDQTVWGGNRRAKRFQHPEAGRIDVAVEILTVSDSDDQHLVVLVPATGSADDRAWREVMGRIADPDVTAIGQVRHRPAPGHAGQEPAVAST